MSVVVAIKTEQGIMMGCDSLVTIGQITDELSNENNCKVFKPLNESDVLVGSVGYLRDINIIQALKNLFEVDDVSLNKIDYQYIISKTVNKIFDTLENNGRKVKFTDADWRMNNNFLLAYKTDCWLIGVDGSVIEIIDYMSMGSGKALAIGALEQSKGESSRERITGAIDSACKNSGVGYPIVIRNTWNDDIEIINKKGE